MKRSECAASAWVVMLSTVLLAGAIPAPALGEPEPQQDYLYRSEVVFDAAPHAWLVQLAEGRKLVLGAGPGPVCKEITKWQRGRALVLAYGTRVGIVLVDVSTGCRMGVPYLDPHPIDLIEKPPPGQTRYALWDAELNRTFQRAMEALGRSEGELGVVPGVEVASALRESQRRWIAFRDAEMEALDALHSGNGRVGWQQVEARRIGLVRARALALVHYAETER